MRLLINACFTSSFDNIICFENNAFKFDFFSYCFAYNCILCEILFYLLLPRHFLYLGTKIVKAGYDWVFNKIVAALRGGKRHFCVKNI